MKWEYYALMTLVCLPLLSNGQRYVLEPDPSLLISESTCIPLFVDTEVRLVRGMGCSDNILLSNEFSTVSFLNIAEDSIDYTFDSPGTYVAFCGSGSGAIAIQSLCFNIQPQAAAPIPTMGEWSLIFLLLLLMIFMTVSFYSQSSAIMNFHTKEQNA